MTTFKKLMCFFLTLVAFSCVEKREELKVEVFETSTTEEVDLEDDL